jgi:small subunit ribosomal protein S4
VTNIAKSKYKVSRRLGVSIWGDAKDPFGSNRNYKPGQHGANSRASFSYYGRRLNAKQKIKAHYGRITETQLKNIFDLAKKTHGNAANNFISLLERRLDMVVYRLNFAPTIFTARQLVSHKHITVNEKVVNIGSYRVKDGDVIGLATKAQSIKTISDAIETLARSVPSYLKLDAKHKTGIFIRSPESLAEVPIPFEVDTDLIVEHYSR